jgi:cbb3-type cytochrome c oxidase subunit I/cbb3-type cytochrome c oxidase subunit II
MTSPSSEARLSTPNARVDHDLVRAHVLAALAGLFVAAAFGLFTSMKFVVPDLDAQRAALGWGRLRINHTQGLFFGWFGNAFLAFLYYVVPRLTDQPVASRRLGWGLLLAWNLGVLLPGWALVTAGHNQSLEWAEFPLAVDAVVMVGLVGASLQFITPFVRMRASDLYISGWYLVAALVFTTLAYPMGNLVPALVPGGMGAAFSGLWTHDAVGLFVTPFALAMSYYVIPAVTRRPIYSHFISLIGFWLLLTIYPLNGMHHYLWSPLPMTAQRGAVLASVLLGMNVVLVVTNLYLSFRGAAKRVATDIALRFVWTGIGCYLLVSVQGATQALLPFNRLVHFTDWVIGHAHLAMLGFASFCTIGALLHAWEHTPGVRYRPAAARWAYWLLLSGLALMVLDLTIAGIVQGQVWQSGAPWIVSVQRSRPYWLLRAVAGVVLVAGFASLLAAFTTGHRFAASAIEAAKVRDRERDFRAPELSAIAPTVHRRLGLMFVSIFVASIAFFALSFVALGWLPAQEVRAAMAAEPGLPPLTERERHGRAIYVREGCSYCHTQQVRMIDDDTDRFGAPSASWEQRWDTPHLWGTRRIGPDLAREAGIRRNDWQLVHLYNPRLVEPTSIMPAFPWLFDGSQARPTDEALDLVAYLQSLGRPMREGYGRGVGDGMSAVCACQSIDPATPTWTPSARNRDIELGRTVFAERCVGCHGPNGQGDGPAAPSLVPHPADLTAASFAPARLSSVLWNGVPGTAMPRFRDLPSEQLRGVVSFVASIGPRASTVSGDGALGRSIYQSRCSPCHGATGRGDGPAEMRLPRLPADFTTKQPTVARVRSVLERGIPGTAMQAMAQNLTAAQLDAVVEHVRSLYGFIDAPTSRPGGAR